MSNSLASFSQATYFSNSSWRRRARLAGGEQRPPHAERLIFLCSQRGACRRADHAAEFFEQRVRVDLPQIALEAAAPAFEKVAEIGEANLRSFGNGDRSRRIRGSS